MEAAPRGVEVILLGYLNLRLQELCEAQEEELATVVMDFGLVNMTDNFVPRKRYIGDVLWKWRIRRDVWQVMG